MNEYEIVDEVLELDKKVFSEDFFAGSNIHELNKEKTNKEWQEFLKDFKTLDYFSPNSRRVKLKDMYYALNPNSSSTYSFVPFFVRAEMLETCIKQLQNFYQVNEEYTYDIRNLHHIIEFLMMNVPLNKETIKMIDKHSQSMVAYPSEILEDFKNNCFCHSKNTLGSTARKNLYKVIDCQLEKDFSAMTESKFDSLKHYLPLLEGNAVLSLIEKYKFPDDVLTQAMQNKSINPVIRDKIFNSNSIDFKFLTFPLQKSIEETIYNSVISTFEVPKDEQDKDAVQEAENILINLVLGGSSFSLSVVRDLCERYEEISSRSFDENALYKSKIYLNSLKKILFLTQDFKIFNTIVNGNYQDKNDILDSALVSQHIKDSPEYKNFIKDLSEDYFIFFKKPVTPKEKLHSCFFKNRNPITSVYSCSVATFIKNAIFNTTLRDETYDLFLKENNQEFLIATANSKTTPPKYNELLKEKSDDLKLIILFKEKFSKKLCDYLVGVVNDVFYARETSCDKTMKPYVIENILAHCKNGFETVNNIKEIAEKMIGSKYCENKETGLLVQMANKLEETYKEQWSESIALKHEFFSDLEEHIDDMCTNYLYADLSNSITQDVYLLKTEIESIINKINSLAVNNSQMTAVDIPKLSEKYSRKICKTINHKEYIAIPKLSGKYSSLLNETIKDNLYDIFSFYRPDCCSIGEFRVLFATTNAKEYLKDLLTIKELPSKSPQQNITETKFSEPFEHSEEER